MTAMSSAGGPAAFRTIVADPPWPEKGGGGRGTQNHYPTVHPTRMAEVMIGSGLWRPAKHAHLYLWVTNTHLEAGINILRWGLGFRYITTITWPKGHLSTGQYFRGKTEHLLFGVRGNGLKLRREHTDRRDLTTLLKDTFELKRPDHSEKPEPAYALIEEASPGPYLEMFARVQRPRWTCWGNQLPESA